MKVTITLTDRQQSLLLANRRNGDPAWETIARKIERAQPERIAFLANLSRIYGAPLTEDGDAE